MTQYELPDGFEDRANWTGMTGHSRVTLCFPNGDEHTYSTCANDITRKTSDCEPWVGFRFVVPLKRKARFVVERDPYMGDRQYYVVDNADGKSIVTAKWFLPTRAAAQRIADIYNEVMP